MPKAHLFKMNYLVPSILIITGNLFFGQPWIELLVSPKDPTDKMEQAGVIYAVKCGGCDSGYVGETGRPLKRIMEHQRDSLPVSQHANDSRHPVNYDQVKVLDRESGWFRRGVKEAIHILTSPSDLNQDRGWYTLPRVYHTLLHSEAAGLSCSATSEWRHSLPHRPLVWSSWPDGQWKLTWVIFCCCKETV